MDDGVDAAEALPGRRDQGFGAGALADITTHIDCLPAERLYLGLPLGIQCRPTGQDDLRLVMPDQVPGEQQTESAGTAGDDADASPAPGEPALRLDLFESSNLTPAGEPAHFRIRVRQLAQQHLRLRSLDRDRLDRESRVFVANALGIAADRLAGWISGRIGDE